MFSSLLIANRGEIACRIIRTARKMGLRSIAVYSDADRDSLHVRSADEAIHIGPAPATESYLVIERIIEAARRSGADAIHPGYGFLSENTAFAAALDEAGIIFVGPHAQAIASMGDKIGSKNLAEKAGVPGVPGYSGDDQADATLNAAAREIGFPVMVKASAGGGGKGMRRVFDEAEISEAIDLARAEAKAAFGDDRLLIEKLILNPRHLEVQIAGDKHGNVVHLFERDCSVQRNNQKVLEEAPAPNLPDTVREKLFERALRLAKEIGYDSLGTVEFIMDAGDDEPAFLEMNTRLQVEHPVTELVTGLDLVELQLRIAAGEKLPFTQGEVSCIGHAIEARITAEKPAQNYLPDTGRLTTIRWPENLRVDTGVDEGAEITPFYDSMIAKMIASGDTRDEAVARLSRGIGKTGIFGVATNTAFLKDCLDRPAFHEGQATTKFLDTEFPEGWQDAVDRASYAGLAAALYMRAVIAARNTGFAGLRTVPGAGVPVETFLVVTDEDGTARKISIRSDGDDFFIRQEEGERRVNFSFQAGGITIEEDGHRKKMFASAENGQVLLAEDGRAFSFAVEPLVDNAVRATTRGGGSGDITAEMPGTISEMKVAEGGQVAAGDALLVMESMKLLITVPAPLAGTVAAIHTSAGSLVNSGDLLLQIASEDD